VTGVTVEVLDRLLRGLGVQEVLLALDALVESIDTAMRHYVGRNIETAAALWQAVGNSLGSRAAESSSANAERPPQVQTATGVAQ
jgi:hypothetical protein